MVQQIHLFAKLPLIDDASSFDLETKAALITAAIIPLLMMEMDADTDKDREACHQFMFQMLNHICKRFWSTPGIASADYATFISERENVETIDREANNLIGLLAQLTAIANGKHPPGFVLNLN